MATASVETSDISFTIEGALQNSLGIQNTSESTPVDDDNGVTVANSHFTQDVGTVYEDQDIARELLLTLNEQRKYGKLTDVTLLCGNLKIACHKSLLAASSPFFQAMFMDDLRESHQNEIHLHEVNSNMLKAIVDYIYLGHIKINLPYAADLLATSCFLQYPKLVRKCEQFLKTQLSPTNCLSTHQLAETYICSHLMTEAWKYALKHFNVISSEEEFLLIKQEKLIQLISDKGIQVSSEDTIFYACLKWIQYGPNRMNDFKSVLKCVQLPFVDSDVLKRMLDLDSPLIDEKECYDMIKTALNIQEIIVKGKQIKGLDLQPRPSMLQEVLIIVGGMTSNRQWQNQVLFYHKKCWNSLTKLPFDHTDYSVASTGEDVYVIGGFYKEHVCNYVWKYSIALDEWQQINGLLTARCNHATTCFNGRIYIVGGESNDKFLTDIEVYDPYLKSWASIGDINPTNSNISVAAMQNKLYIVGWLSFTRVCSLQVFDLEMCECSVILTSGMTRSMFPVMAMQENLYFLGNCKIKEVTVFDPETLVSRVGESMRYKRNCPTAAIVAGKIFVTGGELQHHVNKVESFDPVQNIWIGETPMPNGLCFHGCVSGLKYLGPPFSWTQI